MVRRRSLPFLFSCLALLATACAPRGTTLAPDDAAAESADPQRLTLEAEVANRFVHADQAGHVVVRLCVEATERPDQDRPAATVALVLDTSSSMEGEAIAEARRAAATLLGRLADGDRLALVGFGSKTDVLVPSTVIDDATRKEIAKAIDGITAHGSTDLRGGLEAGFSEVTRHHDPERIERIVLLSDGVPNDAAGIVDIAQRAGAQNVTVTAMGLGLEYQETLLGQVAQTSGGSLHFSEDATQMASVFEDEVLSLDRTIAHAMQLQLRAGPGVLIEQIAGHTQLDGQRTQATIGLGNLMEGETREILVRMSIGEHADGATVELLDGWVAYQDAAAGGGRLEQDVFVSVKATQANAELEQGRSAAVELSAARAFTAAATMQIMQRARAGDLDGALADLDAAVHDALAAVESFDDPELAALARDLMKLRETLPELAPAPPATSAVGKADTKRLHAPLGRPKSSTGQDMLTPAAASDAARHNRAAFTRAYEAVH